MEMVKELGNIFALNISLKFAFFLGILYIIAFVGTIYYGINLCDVFKNSIIEKPIKIILVITPISLFCYPSILSLYPEQIMSINATLGVLEIISLIYLIFWQSLYLFLELFFKIILFQLRILLYSLPIAIAIDIFGFKNISINDILLVALIFRLYEIRQNIKNNLEGVYNNLIHNVKCVFSFK